MAFGDRRDAKRVPISGLMQCCIDLKPYRHENEAYINEKIDVTNLVNYIENKKAEGIHYTYFHAFLTAISRTFYNRPKLNYFITNRHLYVHNKITVGFVAKLELTDASEEVMVILEAEPEDTLQTISDKIATKVNKVRKGTYEKEGANGPLDALSKIPNIFRVPLFGLIKFADKHDILPKVLTEDLIYYTSTVVSNLGSIKCGAVYHNVTDFGTSSSLITIGEIRDEVVPGSDGIFEVHKFCELGVTLDERIADGVYYAKCVKLIAKIMENPAMLEEPVSKPVQL